MYPFERKRTRNPKTKEKNKEKKKENTKNNKHLKTPFSQGEGEEPEAADGRRGARRLEAIYIYDCLSLSLSLYIYIYI